jgi:predicted adenine nucleotide alpha hydrolase (AANH) superfamily ATPase
MKQNYQLQLDRILQDETTAGKKLFLHSCCAPCSSYVLEYLSAYFAITVFYYNPNITESEEYHKRAAEQKRLVDALNTGGKCRYPIAFVEGDYDPDVFLKAVAGHEDDPEGGERCGICFAIRLREAALLAAKGEYDYFTTTLTISPLKDAERLNAIGEAAGKAAGVQFLPSDFKKKNGYKRSIELSKEYDLYRQNYCGCIFSRNEVTA